jgi:serine/threonine protein kinase
MGDRRRERFGRYEILDELGRGAMGVVYKARDPKINRMVAVKTISLAGQRPEDELEYRERFVREAEAAGRLSHPGIVTIFDVGEASETRAPYIVMEFVDGPSLEKLLSGNNRTLPLETALQLTYELAEALDCAHSQGVIHRDLKPANILITPEGRAKITDFGVAKLNLSNLTLGGRTLGTPAYMSPEQLAGEEVDGRSDLFSLGVILYTILTGYRPFQGNSTHTVSFKVVNREPIPASVLDTGLPPRLDYIIGRAMSKDPAQRYQRGSEMALDIQALQQGQDAPTTTVQPSSFVGAAVAQAANLASGSQTTGWRTITPSQISIPRAVPSGRDIAHRFIGKMRRPSFVAATVFLCGLIVLGIGLSRPFVASRISEVVSSEGAPSIRGPRTTPPVVTPDEDLPKTSQAATRLTPSLATRAKVNVQRRTQTPHSPAKAPAVLIGAAPALETAPSISASTGAPATLGIEVDHKFAEANLSIWVDDALTYTHLLEGTNKQHLVVFHHVQGHEIHSMQIPPGRHRLRIQVKSETNSYDQSSSVDGEFVSGKESLLRINFSKSGDMQLNLQ